jgi:hypothetical protein
MRKKSTTGKRKGLDDYGQPVDLKKDAAYSYMRAKSTASSVRSEFEMIRKPTTADRYEYMSTIKSNERNARDILRNQTTVRSGAGFGSRTNKITQPIALPAAKNNPLAGRTVEGGTRSMLEGMKSFMRGGGLRRGSM